MMDRDECVQSLVNIRATLALVADAAATSWDSARRRWFTVDEGIYDLAGTLTDCFRENDIGSVVEWIEFNVADGPTRRTRLIKVLRAVRDEIRHIEYGNPRDPFRWARERIDCAAAKVAGQVTQVADYVGQALKLVEAAPAAGVGECYVTLNQMAAIVQREKKTLRRLYDSGNLPAPCVEGGNGRPHEWRWTEVRPVLEAEYGKQLPAIFPADRFLRS